MNFPLSAIYKFIKSTDTYRYGKNFLISGHFYSKYRTVFSVNGFEEFHNNQFILSTQDTLPVFSVNGFEEFQINQFILSMVPINKKEEKIRNDFDMFHPGKPLLVKPMVVGQKKK
jgi:hypothetical protein